MDAVDAFCGFFTLFIKSPLLAVLTVTVAVGMVFVIPPCDKPFDHSEYQTAIAEANTIANDMDQHLDEDGRYVRVDPGYVNDHWGTPFSVSYATAYNNEHVEVLTLHSFGPDKAEGTEDDFKITRKNVVPIDIGSKLVGIGTSFIDKLTDKQDHD